MAKHFEFADFVEEFKVNFTVFDEVQGYYDDTGKWIDGSTVTLINDQAYRRGEMLFGSVEQSVENDEINGLTESDGERPREMSGIILPLNNDELRNEVNGSYTSKDRKIYTTEPLKIGQQIEYKSQRYTIDSSKPYEDYADVYIYFAKGGGAE